MAEDENERTLFVGSISDKITEEMLWELFLQAGPLEKVRIPSDRDGGNRKGFAFVTFKHSVSVPYSIRLMDGIRLFGRSLRLQSRSGSSHNNPTPPHMRPPMRSYSAPHGAPPAHGAGALAQQHVIPQNLMSLPPLMLPPIQMQSFNDSPQSSPSHTPEYSHQKPDYSHGKRHERRHSGHRYDPRDSSSSQHRDSSSSQHRGRHSNSSQQQQPMNLNPQQRHMQPSPRRNQSWKRY